MPESVRMDMGKIVGLAELVQPIGYAVRVYNSSVILCEYETGILPDMG